MFLVLAVPFILFLFAWNLIIPDLANGLLNKIEKLVRLVRTARQARAEEVATSVWVKEGAHIF